MNLPENLHQYPYVVIDYETTGLSWFKDKIFGVAIATPDGKSGYWDLREDSNVIRWMREQFPRIQCVVAHNAKYECHFSREAGVFLPEGRVVCTMTNAALLDENMLSYDLDTVGKKCINVGKDDTIWALMAAQFGGKPTLAAQIGNLHRAPVALVAKYARQDVTTTRMLHTWQQEQIAQQDAIDREESPERLSLIDVVKLEQELLPVLVRMEQTGIVVDVGQAESLARATDKEVDEKYGQLYRTCGKDFNINSAPQLRKLFNPQKGDDGTWRTDDGTMCEVTDSGNPSLDSPTLRKMKDPRAQLIVDLRATIKMRDTFLRGHIIGNARENYGNHTVHCNFNQAKSENGRGTYTGRLSADSPALHQIHKRDKERAKKVRGLFLPHTDQRWLCFDWDQFEFRWFAHYVNDPRINRLYADDADTDFHQVVANMTGLPRSARHPGDPNAKQINLGLVFGMGQGRLAAEMGLPYTVERSRRKEYLLPGAEAMAVFEQYHGSIPGIKELLGSVAGKARSRGYVRTIYGRHIRFPRGMGVHKAGGIIFQGSSADCMKRKLVEIDEYIRSGEVRDDELRLMLSVHDETDLSCTTGPRHRKYAKDVQRILQTFDGKECPIRCKIPIRAEAGFGDNWWQACSDEATKYIEEPSLAAKVIRKVRSMAKGK